MAAYRPFLTFVSALTVLGIAQAQPGTIDPTFNPGDVGNGYGDGPDGIVYSTVLPSGKVLIAGMFSHAHGYSRNRIARLNGDGTLDMSFNPGTGFNNTVFAVAVQADGKVVVGGDFTAFAGVPRNRLARLNSDGSLDASFVPGTGFNYPVRALAVQPDGKVLVGGAFTTFNGTPCTKLLRFVSDGTLDAGFNAGAIPGSNSVAVQVITLRSNSQILAGGNFGSVSGNSRPGLAMFNTNGSLVAAFPAAGLTDLAPHSIIFQPDGKYLLGTFNSAKRLNSDGTLDGGFVTYPVTGGPLTPDVDQVLLQPDGKALLFGDFTTYNGTLVYRRGMARLNANGSLDASFHPMSTGLMALLPDGDILVRGCVRLNPDGSKEQAYYPGTGCDATVNCMLTQADGRILLGGSFSRYNSQDVPGFVRLDPDGDKDPYFNAALAPISDPGSGAAILDMALQPDGKPLVARAAVYRLNSDGSLDPSFDPGVGGGTNSGGWRTLGLLPDGKVLLAGDFTNYNGIARRALVRLHANGAVDETFDANAALTNEGVIYDIAVQPDGKILFTKGDMVGRLNADGSLDPTFTGPAVTGLQFSPIVKEIELQADGAILIGGALSSCDGEPRKGIARLHADGSLDESFNTTGPDIYEPWAIAVQSDGRIVVGGVNSYPGSPRKAIARLHADGSVDATFITGTGTANYLSYYSRVEAVAVQADGQVLVGGYFTAYNGTGRNRIMRLNGGGGGYVDLSAKVLLDGPYNSSTQLMNDGLRSSGLLLTDEPYAILGVEHVGTGATAMNAGAASVTGNNAIVDWVLVELRDRDDATSVLASRAGLVQRDGDVVDVDGHSPVRFDATPDNYFVSVRHRNHLGAISASSSALGPQVMGLDLTHPNTPTYGTDARKPVGNKMVLWSGDVTFNGMVKYTGTGNDRDPVLVAVGSFTPNSTISGYRQEDVNLDGVVKYTGAANDRDPILITVGSTVPTNVRVAQLP